MTTQDRWLLPDGIEEVLPGRADQVEALRRQLLDLYRGWGYQLVIPPIAEYTESLLIGLGSDVDLLTFKMTDQISGRALGIRADITPQVARIDAHSLGQEGGSRLGYAGSTLHTRPKYLLASRSPIQVGAELYGDNSLEADIEVISLMLATLEAAGIERCVLDLGHVGIYQAILDAADFDPEQERQVFDALQRKSLPDLEAALVATEPRCAGLILALAGLHGNGDVLERARALCRDAAPAGLAAIDALQTVADTLRAAYPGIGIYFDLGELRGYHYHTGIVFAAYTTDHGQALANGGRYDDVGAVFGRARPATGFNTDLKALLALLPAAQPQCNAISMPADRDAALREKVAALRAAGEVVINSLGGRADPRCSRELVRVDGVWRVQALEHSAG